MTYILMPIVFVLGIIGIAFEDKIHINKSAVALGMCVLLWGMLIVDTGHFSSNAGYEAFVAAHPDWAADGAQLREAYVSASLTEHLGDVSGTLFFVLCSMLLVNTVDRFGGFKELTSRIVTNDKRRLLWIISFLSFFLSALLDNLAACIVVIAILRKLVPDATDRMKYACMSVIACNAGGSWSPIGDVTTLLLWINGRITAPHQILHLFVPALVNMMVPLILCHFGLFRKGSRLRVRAEDLSAGYLKDELPPRARITVFWIGMLSLVMVPVYQMWLGIPAFLGIIIGVIILWIYTDLMFSRHNEMIKLEQRLRVVHLLHDADLATIFYFLGILMSVDALITGGQLQAASGYLDGLTHISESLFANNMFLAWLIGISSSFIDNVAMVAATMGMYPIGYNAMMGLNGSFWAFLTYSAVTGGSLLIIGSATGVTVMGLEKISFGYYLKRFSGLALLGYFAGSAVCLLLV